MKKKIITLFVSLFTVLPLAAQTEVSTYRPGVTEEGITYFLPRTAVRVVVTARKTHYKPGEFAAYAERYLKLKDAPQVPYDVWSITDVKLCPYGIADKDKAFTIKLKTKTSAPLVSLTQDYRLLAINAQAAETDAALPEASVTPDAVTEVNGEDFKTEEILAAGSTAKMAELTANAIFDIRESRGQLTMGQADYMPSDGEQLRLMLVKLDTQEQGLLSLFKGTTQSETHVFCFDLQPTESVQKATLFNFSKYLGVVDADDPAGVPIYYSVEPLGTLPAAIQTDPNAKQKKEVEDVRYALPDRVRVNVFSTDKVWTSQQIAMAQFGRVEHLGGDLFNKKYTTRVQLSPVTGGIVKIEADKPE